jgi:hypothetical protein
MKNGHSAAALVIVLAAGAPAAGQTTAPLVSSAPRLVVSGGLVLGGGYDVGSRTADLRRNAIGPDAAFTWFRTDTAMERTVGIETRLGVALRQRLSIEIGASYARPTLRVTVSDDGEAAAVPAPVERVSQYGLELNGVVHPWKRASRARATPYLLGGVGYIRQVHENRATVEAGRLVHGGGGLRWAVRGSVRGRTIGLRAEGRIVRRSGGIDFEDRSRTFPAGSMLAFAAF